ncbi:MAG TPA: PadR family transcriptional regulator [Candidatus Acidoferrales bacterium]|nr:PadR family transcriptional regulator [Candidatus Acidoferrales bacterium]
MRARKEAPLTTPDLVLLSLLAERAMHGYEANLELERRQVRDWAGISRPQVYYSLEKLSQLGLIHTTGSDEPAAGPERRVFATTAKGRTALADALEREDWTTGRDLPAFGTWLALSWQARPGVLRKQLARRREFLETELAREEATLQGVFKEVGHRYHEAFWLVSFTIHQMKLELRWLRKLSREIHRRASARNPQHTTKPALKE